jgi:macrolide transport system ATP-binding/permease protein
MLRVGYDTGMDFIRIEDIRKTYHRGEIDVSALRGVSFSIRRGEMVALMGASGSGKTTLMNILGCLDRPDSGEYWLDGRKMSGLSPDERALIRSAKIGFVFQTFNLLARTTALNNVSMPLNYAARRPSLVESKLRARRILMHVGLEHRLKHDPSKLSGGQQQRVAIARALVNKPALILADEPTGNLDSHTSVEILQMFRQLNVEGITVIVVTHDPAVAAYADRIIRIGDGLVESDDGSSARAPDEGCTSVAGNGDPDAGNGRSDVFWSPAAHAQQVLQVAVAAPAEAIWARSETVGEPFCQTLAPDTATTSEATGSVTKRPVLRFASVPSQFFATLRTAATALRRHALRSSLSALGIAIGIGAVVALVEIGQGTSDSIRQTIATMGASMVQIDPNGAVIGGVNTGAGGRVTLTPADCDAIRRDCAAVRWAAPSVDCRMQIVYGNRNWSPRNILGTIPDYLLVRNWTNLQEGVPFTDDDVRDAACVCLIGQTPARELFGSQSPVGKKVRVKNLSLKVVGVLSPKGANAAGMDQDDFIIAPLTTVKFRLSSMRDLANQTAAAAAPNQVNSLNQRYPNLQTPLLPQPSTLQTADTPRMIRYFDLDDIWVSAASPRDVPQVMREISELLRERHRLLDDAPDDFRVRDLTEASEALASTSRLMTNLLMCVALCSLTVGGIGIMNIMLVSVTERTREIGLRMAVGARAGDIRWQMLTEAVLLCLAGGIAGIVLGRGISIAVTWHFHWRTIPSWPAMIAAVVVSVTTGIAFGYYPAWKASRLDPIEALRYE